MLEMQVPGLNPKPPNSESGLYTGYSKEDPGSIFNMLLKY